MPSTITLYECIYIQVLPCELGAVCAAQSICGFLQECVDHLRRIVLISDKPAQVEKATELSLFYIFHCKNVTPLDYLT